MNGFSCDLAVAIYLKTAFLNSMYIKRSEPQVPVGYSVGREVLAWAQCKNWGGIVVVLTGSWGCSCFIHGDHCLHPLTQASYGSAPVKEKQYSFILLPTILSQTSVLRLRPCWLWTAADNEHLVRVLLYLQVTGALLLIIKPFLVIIIFPPPPPPFYGEQALQLFPVTIFIILIVS